MLSSKALEKAIKSQNLAELQALLHDANQANSINSLPDSIQYLMLAIDTGDIEIVQALLESGINVNQRDEDGWTALMYASLEGYSNIVEALVRAGSDVNAESLGGDYALYIAAHSKNQEVFDYLAPLTNLELRREIEQCLSEAAQKNETQTPIELGVERLVKAAADGNLFIVTNQIRAGVDINAVNEFGETALKVAIVKSHKEVVQVLVEAGAGVNAVVQNMPLLHHAAMFSKPEIVQYLLQSGADVSQRDVDGFTALMRSATSPYSDREVIRNLLYEAGASEVEVNSANLLNAFFRSDFEQTKVLLQAKARMEIDNFSSAYIFHIAAEQGNIEIINLLIQSGVDVNVIDHKGKTALMKATMGGSLKTVKALLQSGANPHLQDQDGYTALIYAQEVSRTNTQKVNHPKILKLLQDAAR